MGIYKLRGADKIKDVEKVHVATMWTRTRGSLAASPWSPRLLLAFAAAIQTFSH